MEDIRIKLSALWIARMLTGFLGDVLRFMEPGMLEKLISGETGGMALTNELLLVSAVIMEIPILMVILVLGLKYNINRWANIVVAIFFFCFDLIGLPTYTALYSSFLIIVGLILNVLVVWYAWNWKEQVSVKENN